MSIDYKALCAEQLPELRGMFERILCVARSTGGPTYRPVGNIELADRLIDAVMSWSKNSLAQPEPKEPTDEELLAIAIESELVASNGTNPFREDSDIEDEVMQFARTVLARWPLAAIEPVPVSERLPGEGDCDPSFQCWWFTPSEEKWILWPIKWAGPECSHWLPHYALPIPAATEKP